MMKSRRVVTVLALVVLSLAACAGDWPGVSSSWQGRSLDQLVTVWGPPQAIYEMDDGGKAVSFANQFLYKGTSYNCTATFNIDPSNQIVSSSIHGKQCDRLVGGKYAP